MYPEQPSASVVRQTGIAVLALFPALFIGFYVGMFTADIGSPRDLGSILLRGLACALPSVLLALLSPRFWFLPVLIYGYGFHGGYTFGDGIGVAISTLVAIPFAFLTGQRVGTPSAPTHPELLWVFVLALWLTALVSFLRRHYSHPNERNA